jgi:hypothetical protein
MDTKALKENFQQLKTERSNWENLWQICGEVVHQNKQNFTSQPSDGEFLTKDIYDSTATFAAQNSASALLGMLWPGTAKQAIEISPPDDLEADSELAKFYDKMTERTVRAMDDPAANLTLALDEYMLDQMVFGTSGVGVERGDESQLLFKPYGVKELHISEGRSGRVDEEYLLFEWTLKRLVKEYGLENVSEKSRKAYNDGKRLNKVKVLICITEREKPKAEKGVLAMPYQSIHMEYDSCHLLKESGFAELPIKVGRFRKLAYEVYGRSFAMSALSDTRELGVHREGIIIGVAKNLDMPKGVFNDGIMGGSVIDTSPGAVTVFDASSAMGSGQPIFEIGQRPDVSIAEKRIEDLKNSIAQHFALDRLIDFNNDTQMTFGEAQIRNQIRNASLASLFSRQISEVFTPLINRSISLLMEDGVFGVVKGSDQEMELKKAGKPIEYLPDILASRMREGKDIYQITYKTQAGNAAKAEEYLAIIDVLSFGIQAMQVDPTVRHRVNLHKGVKSIGNIRSLPVGIIRQDDEVDKLIEQEQQAQSTQQGLEMGVQAAGIVDSLASANKAARV